LGLGPGTMCVVPYYTVVNESVVNDGDRVEATFHVGEVEAGRPVEFVGLYVSESSIVDRSNAVVQVEEAGGVIDLDGAVNLEVQLPEGIRVGPASQPRDRVWARIGIKTAGVEDMMFGVLHRVGL